MICTDSFSTFLFTQAAGPTTRTTIPGTRPALEPVLDPLPVCQAHGQAALMGRTNRQASSISNNKVNLAAIMLTKSTIPTITKATKATKGRKGIPARVIIKRKARWCRPTGLGQE